MYIDADGRYVVDGEICDNVNAAYASFKRIYNKSLGKAGKHRIENLKPRKSLVSHRGMDFDKEYIDRLNEEFKDTKKVRCYVLGVVGISYAYMFGEWNYDPAFRDYDNDKSERYFDWLISAGTTAIRMCGRMDRMVVRRINGKQYGYYIYHKRKSRKTKNKTLWEKKKNQLSTA